MASHRVAEVAQSTLCKMASAPRQKSGLGLSAGHSSTASGLPKGMSRDTGQCLSSTTLTACLIVFSLGVVTCSQNRIWRQTGRNAPAAEATKADTTGCTAVFLVSAGGDYFSLASGRAPTVYPEKLFGLATILWSRANASSPRPTVESESAVALVLQPGE